MYLSYLPMVGFMVVTMIGIMATMKVLDYAHWYFLERKEEQFRRLLCLEEADLIIQMEAFNITSKDVVERANSLPHNTEEEMSRVEILRRAAREVCLEKLNEFTDKTSSAYHVNH